MRQPQPHFSGEPDFVARMRALYQPQRPTAWQRLTTLWRALGADLLALCLLPVVITVMALLMFVVWVVDSDGD
jgi:hypothetical protein